MLQSLIILLESTAENVPVPVFIFIGSLVEEIIAIIPSPFVTTLAGSLASAQNSSMWYILALAFVAMLAKTFGCLIFYLAADKSEDILSRRFGKLMGFSHKSIESIGKRLDKGSKDDIVIFLLRATPLMPSAPVSLAAGLIRLNLTRYLIASAAGMYVRSLAFLYLGYTATGTLDDLQSELAIYERIGSLVFIAAMILILFFVWRNRKKI